MLLGHKITTNKQTNKHANGSNVCLWHTILICVLHSPRRYQHSLSIHLIVLLAGRMNLSAHPIGQHSHTFFTSLSLVGDVQTSHPPTLLFILSPLRAGPDTTVVVIYFLS